MLIEAYPAVRADADWKKAAFIFSPNLNATWYYPIHTTNNAGTYY